jgi:hypothetical protein
MATSFRSQNAPCANLTSHLILLSKRSPTGFNKFTMKITNRRQFITQSAAALGSFIGTQAVAAPSTTSETLVQQLHKSLNEAQTTALCLPYDDPLRLKVDNNWHIRPKAIRDVLNPDQQDLVRQIFDGLHSDEYKKEVWRQFDQDNKRDGGFGSASIALFGQPGSGKFEFVLTGRHCTRRCDGDSAVGTAFGGPIFYGHAAKGFDEEPNHPGNAYWFQALRANEVFQALDGKQRATALLETSRGEHGTKTVELSRKTTGLPGIRVGSMSSDQKNLVRLVLADLIKPFRETDAKEALSLIDASGMDDLHMAFSKNEDVGNDGVWDTWQVEGPNMVWYFRGDPHVHCWAHIKAPI